MNLVHTCNWAERGVDVNDTLQSRMKAVILCQHFIDESSSLIEKEDYQVALYTKLMLRWFSVFPNL